MNAYLLFSFDFGPPTVERIFNHIDPSGWDHPIDPDRFSPREIIAHLADWEPIMLGRMQMAVERPGAVLEAYDEVKMAEEHGYGISDPRVQLERWKRARTVTASWVKSLSPQDWSKTVRHPERGDQSAEDL